MGNNLTNDGKVINYMETTDFKDYGEIVASILDPKDRANWCRTNQEACKSKAISLFGPERALRFEKEGKILGRELADAYDLEAKWQVSYFDDKRLYSGENSMFKTSPSEIKKLIDSINLKEDSGQQTDSYVNISNKLFFLRISVYSWRNIVYPQEDEEWLEKYLETTYEVKTLREKIKKNHNNIWPSIIDFSNMSLDEANKFGATREFMNLIRSIADIIKTFKDDISTMLTFECPVLEDTLEFFILSQTINNREAWQYMERAIAKVLRKLGKKKTNRSKNGVRKNPNQTKTGRTKKKK